MLVRNLLLCAALLGGCEGGRYGDPEDAEQVTLDNGQTVWEVQCTGTTMECGATARQLCSGGYKRVSAVSEDLPSVRAFNLSLNREVIISRGNLYTWQVVCTG